MKHPRSGQLIDSNSFSIASDQQLKATAQLMQEMWLRNVVTQQG
jgi:hypothetical protein